MNYLSDKQLEDAMNYLTGSCMAAEVALELYLERSSTCEEFSEFERYLDGNEVFECENCGWWGYSGETVCDCAEEEEE